MATETPLADSPHAPLRPAFRCRRCFYLLRGLAHRGTCPECALEYDAAVPGTYLTQLPFAGWPLWLPGLGLAIGLGTAATCTLLAMGSIAWGLALGVPLAVGAILGYASRRGFGFVAALVVPVVCGIVIGAMTMRMSGLYCGTVLGLIAIPPTVVGALAGFLLRQVLEVRPRASVVLGLAALPVIVGALERPCDPGPLVRVSTTSQIQAPPSAVWDSLVYFEEIDGPPPLLLRLGLPRPMGTRGSMRRVGDVKVCRYDRGRLVKVISSVDAPRRLEFVLTQQHVGFERSVALRGGSFALQSLPAGATRLTLTTAYQPRLRPRFAWSWAERLAVHALHGHLLDGIRRDVEGRVAPSQVAVDDIEPGTPRPERAALIMITRRRDIALVGAYGECSWVRSHVPSVGRPSRIAAHYRD